MVKGDLLPGITIGELTDFTFERGGDIFYFLINISLSFLTIVDWKGAFQKEGEVSFVVR